MIQQDNVTTSDQATLFFLGAQLLEVAANTLTAACEADGPLKENYLALSIHTLNRMAADAKFFGKAILDAKRAMPAITQPGAGS